MKVLLFALALIPGQLIAAEPSFMKETQDWQAERENRLKADNGWLTLAARLPLKPGNNTVGTGKDNTVVLPEAFATTIPKRLGSLLVDPETKTVKLQLEPGITMTSQGKPFEGERAFKIGSEKPDWISLGRVSMHIISSGNQFLLRVADNQSATRKEFPGCTWYAPNEKFKVKAKFVPHPNETKIKIVNILDQVSEVECVGYLEFSIDDQQFKLDALQEGKGLFIIFRDATAGDTTYRPARFLTVDKLPEPNEVVTLDFNRAYNPPCTFSEFTTCPIAPKQNILKIRIEAGETYRAKK